MYENDCILTETPTFKQTVRQNGYFVFVSLILLLTALQIFHIMLQMSIKTYYHYQNIFSEFQSYLVCSALLISLHQT